MKLLKEYFRLQEEIHKYFGYVEDWVTIPLDDATEYYWHLTDDEVHFAKSKENLQKIIDNDYDYDVFGVDQEDYYVNDIYRQRFLPKYIYKAPDFTMVCVDTNTDGNKYLSVFDNNKEVEGSDEQVLRVL